MVVGQAHGSVQGEGNVAEGSKGQRPEGLRVVAIRPLGPYGAGFVKRGHRFHIQVPSLSFLE